MFAKRVGNAVAISFQAFDLVFTAAAAAFFFAAAVSFIDFTFQKAESH
jgi:hypothetical protein